LSDPRNPPRPPSTAVNAADCEGTYRVIEEAVLGLWNVVDDLTRVTPPRQDFYRVTIFGSARIQPGDPVYEDVRWLAAELAGIGCDIITGGGPGLMQAANEGERAGDVNNLTRSFGLRIDLAFEQGTNPFVDQVFKHRTFFSRLNHFVRLSSAFVVVPGGIGTLLELSMVWQLLQVRHLHGTPLILVGDMWTSLVDWSREHMLVRSARPLAGPLDVDIPTCVPTVQDAAALLKTYHEQWKSTRPEPASDCADGVRLSNSKDPIAPDATIPSDDHP
jgi:uncharacterized protein (TIGR00730 family)